MALWQYTFQILTKESIDEIAPNYIFNNGNEGFDEEPFWNIKLINKSVFSEIDDILPKNKSWNSEIDLYGNQESNCFEVLFNNDNNVESVSFRIDFRTNYEFILSNIIEFCIKNSLIIIDECLQITILNYEYIRNLIENSPQVKVYYKLSDNPNNK